MKKFVVEMLKLIKPWGIGFVITVICWLISLLINAEIGYTLYWMSISFLLGGICIILFTLMIVLCISSLIGKFIGKIARKCLQVDKTDFEKNKDYYRDILGNNTPLILGYLDNLELDKNDLIAEILYFINKDVVKVEEGSLKKNSNWINLNLKESELKILDKIILGKLVIQKNDLLELRYIISRDAENLELLQRKSIKRRKRKMMNNRRVEHVLKISIIIMFTSGIMGVLIPEITEICEKIMIGSSILPFILYFIVFVIYLNYKENLGLLYKRTAKGCELNQKLEGLKNYLKDYSLMNEREAKEIELWDDYLIYSVMFGQNKKIIEEYEKYIEIVED